MEVITYSSNVTKLTTEIKVIQDNVCQGMIEIGKRLIEIKKELGHGQWLSYLDNELGYKPTTAGRLIRIANEFSDINCSTLNNLQSSKIIALLDVPAEYREDFINKTDIDKKTVKQLQEEIKMFKKQYDDSSNMIASLEMNKKVLEQELQREKSKQPEVVYKTDQKDIDRLRLLETVNKELSTKTSNLEKSLSMNKQLLENYKTDSEEYRKLKLQMSKLQVEMDSVAQKQVSVLKLTELASEIEFFLHSKLAPTKYKDFMSVLNNDDAVRCNFIHTIEIVGDWYREMKTYVNENNYENIITVEVN